MNFPGEKYSMETMVYLENNNVIPPSSEVRVVTAYETEKGEDGVIQKRVQVPLRLLLRACQPESTAPYAINIKSTDPVLNFSQIFPGRPKINARTRLFRVVINARGY